MGDRSPVVRSRLTPVRKARQCTHGIGRRQAGYLVATAVPQSRKRVRDTDDLGRGVSPRMQPGGRNIGRIGFKHQRLSGKFTRQPTDAKRAFKGHRPTKSEYTSLLQKRGGLLRAAIERMGDAACHTGLPEMLQHLVLSLSDMQDNRQVKLSRELQLSREKSGLPGPVESRNKVIETNLTDRHQRGIIVMRQ